MTCSDEVWFVATLEDLVQWLQSDSGTVALLEKLMAYRSFRSGRDKDNGEYWTSINKNPATYFETLNAALIAVCLKEIENG